MEPLTISELEQATGIGRGAIYYYIRYGLLPSPQKASATRSVYDQSHVELVGEITRLKKAGHSLREIRGQLRARIESAAGNSVDLVARQSQETRRLILDAAARRFARYGYQQTHIMDICDDVGVTTQVLYGHFPSKRHLFIACYNVYFTWVNGEIGRQLEEAADPAERLAWSIHAAYRIQAFSPDLQAMARVEAIHEKGELHDLLRETYTQMLAQVEADMAAVRDMAANPGLFDDELIAYAMLGALENMMMRASWDKKYARLDIIRNLIGVHLALRAAYSGRLDLTEDWARIADLAEQIAALNPKAGKPGKHT